MLHSRVVLSGHLSGYIASKRTRYDDFFSYGLFVCMWLVLLKGGMICVYGFVDSLRWLLFATQVQGTLIGLRERKGPVFVPVYQYSDETGVTHQAARLEWGPLSDPAKAGDKADLLVFADRPDLVRGLGAIWGCILILPVLAVMFAAPVFNLLPTETAMIVVSGEAIAAAGIAVRWPWTSPGWPQKYGPLERVEDISPERMAAARRYAERTRD